MLNVTPEGINLNFPDKLVKKRRQFPDILINYSKRDAYFLTYSLIIHQEM